MKKILKFIIKVFAKSLINFLSKINVGRYFIDKLTDQILSKKKL